MVLPDLVLSVVFAVTFRLVGLLGDAVDEALRMTLGDLSSIFKERSELSIAVKRFMLEARPSQMKSFIRGFLVNHIFNW